MASELKTPEQPALFYWLVTSGSMALGKQGPYPKPIAEKLRDKWREEHPGKAASIEMAWEAPFEKMIPVKIAENRFGAKATHLAYIYKADTDWFYVYVNTRVGKKYRRRGKGGMDRAGDEVWSTYNVGHSHTFAPGEVERVEALLKGEPFDTGLRVGVPD